jgi:hypothetical protein
MRYVPAPCGASSSGSKEEGKVSVEPTCKPARVVIGSRDETLFGDLFLVQVMARDQIRSLFGCSIPRCNLRLSQLVEAGFLGRCQFHSAVFGDQALYFLGKKARPYALRFMQQQGLELEPLEIRSQLMRPSLSLLEHSLAISRVFVAVKLAVANNPALSLRLWLPERVVRAEYEVRRANRQAATPKSVQKEVWAPDAYFEIAGASGPVHAFAIEADLSHTNSREWTAKIRTSERFRSSGLAETILGISDFKTLVVTDGGDRRVKNVLAIAEQEKGRSFLAATFDDVERDGLLSPVWRSAFSGQRRTPAEGL